MKICPECKNYVRAELDHCPSCGAALISLSEAARTLRAQQAEHTASPRPAAVTPAASAPATRKPAAPTPQFDLRALPLPGRTTLIGLAIAVVVYAILIAAAAMFLRSLNHVPLLILGTIMGGAVGALLGLGKSLAGLPPRQDNILLDIWPGLGAGAFTGLFLSFFSVQENLLAPEVLLVATAGAVLGVLFSLAFSWGSGPEGARGIRGLVGNPVVGLLLGICFGIGMMLGLGNLMFQLRRPGA